MNEAPARALSSYIHDEDKGPKLNAEVIWFDRGRSFGFLRVAGYPNDLFVFASEFSKAAIAFPPEVNRGEGTLMRCRIGRDRKGKPWAIDLEYR